MKLKTPPQPLVFAFEGPTALCAAVAELYRLAPGAASSLCEWRGKYYLQVDAGLGGRRKLMGIGGRWGRCLGAAPVMYAFCREHGREISEDPVAQLGGALMERERHRRRRKTEE